MEIKSRLSRTALGKVLGLVNSAFWWHSPSNSYLANWVGKLGHEDMREHEVKTKDRSIGEIAH